MRGWSDTGAPGGRQRQGGLARSLQKALTSISHPGLQSREKFLF